ncbi:MAG: signal peptidase I [Smithellaceae bacterium]|nr:signal peptidase I [Smithellaceae bacterium]
MKETKLSPVKTKSKIREFVEAILTAFLIAAFIISFVVQAFKIPSGSMIPTLLVGDHLFVNKFIYGVKIPYFRITIIPITDPKRGDVIVFIYPQDRSKDFIKRVIGTAGDKIEMKNKKLFINDQVYTDTFGIYNDDAIYPADAQPRDNFGPVTVPQGSLFVMGDNRDHSLDSRFWGFVDLKDVQGKAFIIYWSWDAEEKNVRWDRLAKLIK